MTRLLTSLLAVFACALAPAAAAEIALSWAPPQDDVTAGFELEVLDDDGQLVRVLDAGMTTHYVVDGLEDGRHYRFRLRAYDRWDQSAADASREIRSMPKPRIDAVDGFVEPGKASRISLYGANFTDGAWLVSSRSNVVVEEVLVMRHDLLIATVRSEEPGAPLAPEELLVVNPVRKSASYVRAHPELLDFDRSGKIDASDIAAVEALFGVEAIDPRFVPAADLTGDGVIDGEDAAMIRAGLATRDSSRMRRSP